MNKRTLRYIICIMICFYIILVSIPTTAIATGNYSTERIYAICEEYNLKTNMYWSYSSSAGNSTAYTASSKKANTSTSNSRGKPGEPGYYGYKFAGGSECWAFAGFIGYKLSGHTNPYSTWNKLTSLDEIKNAGGVQVGDIIRTKGSTMHSAIVLSVSQNGVIKVAECWGGSNNIIKIGSYFRSYSYNSTIEGIIKNNSFDYLLRAPDNHNADYQFQQATFYGISKKALTNDPADDQCYIKDQPYEDSTTNDIVPKNELIEFIGIVTNKYGNKWYKTSDGNYIYSADVFTHSELFSISAKFLNTEKRNTHTAPYQDSDTVKTIPRNKAVKIKSFVSNSHDNIWAQLDDGSYLCFYDSSTKENKLKFSSHITQPIENTTRPTGNITVSSTQGFWLKGPIEAKVPFLTVTTRIIDRETGKDVAKAGSPASISPSSTLRKLDIYETKINGKSLDSQTLFRKLTEGWYRYELNAQFGFQHNGITFKFGEEMNLVSSDFSVGKSDDEEPPTGDEVLPPIEQTPPPAPDEEPPTGDEVIPPVEQTPTPIPTGLKGDVNVDGKVNIIDIMLTARYVYADSSISINLYNADMDDNDRINLVDIMKIARIVYP